jgi:GT2 family glycosyltransferase
VRFRKRRYENSADPAKAVSFSIVIPSARAENLIPCIQAILTCEPQLPPSSIIVVDDGARAESEAILPAVTWVEGQKPFIFARNVNLGIFAAGSADVIVLNDDARLITACGFSWLSELMRSQPTIGICSAGISGFVCNQRQVASEPIGFRYEPHRLAFVCVYLPRAVIARVGTLDERFVGYGFEDFDYCRRVTEAGFQLAIWDGCVVDHSGESIASSYRIRPDLPWLYEHNRNLYLAKWGFTS